MKSDQRVSPVDSIDHKSLRLQDVNEVIFSTFEKKHCTKQNRLPSLEDSGRISENFLYNRPVNSTLFGSKQLLYGGSNKNTKYGKVQLHRSIRVNSREVDTNIKKLQSSLEAANLENKRLREFSVGIMRRSTLNDAGEVHSFYQNVVIPENEKNISLLRTAIKTLNKKVFELETENKKLKKENRCLSIRINNLKACLAKKLEDTKLHTLDDRDIAKALNTRRSITKLNGTNLNHSISAANMALAMRGMKENVHLELIWGSLKKISKANSLTSLIESLYQELGVLIKSNNVGIFIIDPTVRKLYIKEKGKLQSMRFSKYIIDMALSDCTNYIAKPAFNSLGDINIILRTEKSITIPISALQSKSTVYLSVQLDAKGTNSEEENRELWVRLSD